MTVQQAIKNLRNEMGGLSQERFAHRLGLTVRTVTRWESADEGPSPHAFVLFYELSKECGRNDLAAVFKDIAFKKAEEQIGITYEQFGEKVHAFSSAETREFIRDTLLEICIECDGFESNRDDDPDLAVACVDRIRGLVEKAGKSLFIDFGRGF